MEWLAALRGQIVGLDTAPLIYFIEEDPAYLEKVTPFFEAVDRGEFQVVTSAVTLLEVLVHPIRRGDAGLALRYREILLGSRNVSCVALSNEIAEEAARLRAESNIRTPDAIHLATAVRAGAASFLTNDTHLPPLPTLRILVLDELSSESPAP